MRPSLLGHSLTQARRQHLETLLWWGTPPLAIPTLRWFNDPPESRRRLFIRDFSTYSLGTVVFFASKHVTEWMAAPLARKFSFNPEVRVLLGSTVGLGANLLFAGIGAIKFSKWIDGNFFKQSNPALTHVTKSASLDAGTRLNQYSWSASPSFPASPQPAKATFQKAEYVEPISPLRLSGAFNVFS